MVHLTASQWIIYGALSVVWAVMGYRLSENDRKMLGRTPWGLPSMLWAFFWLCSLLIGLILYLIAHSAGVRQAHQHPPVVGPSGSGPASPVGAAPSGGRSPSASDLFPAYPRPANVPLAQSGEPTPFAVGAPVLSPEVEDGPLDASAERPQSPPAWHPDPSGRFHYRWWDGSQWTSQVSSDGRRLIDTNPDQRIGPY